MSLLNNRSVVDGRKMCKFRVIFHCIFRRYFLVSYQFLNSSVSVMLGTKVKCNSWLNFIVCINLFSVAVVNALNISILQNVSLL